MVRVRENRHVRLFFLISLVPMIAVLISVSACDRAGVSGAELGRDHVSGPVGLIPPGEDGVGLPRSGPSGIVGESCSSDDPTFLCLGLKYVVYTDIISTPIVSRKSAIGNVKLINKVWNQCKIGFQIDEFLAAPPADYGLRYQTANYAELDAIRNTFLDNSTLLVVTTGTWDRTGSLGNTGANAWTAMPNGPPYGVIMERPVGVYANIIAHELGHYLNVGHVSDNSSLMNPIIYTNSTGISRTDCTKARSAARYFWSKMIR
ncbi:MAG TPA: matrixin family metalloprotease [Bdellovibrionota bacterium]|nr:matrixin family metalloprotease [Bdellovibrionota bacterium]